MSEKSDNKEWTNREVGALWLNVNQKTNEKYLTGQINGEKVIMFKNKYKDENPKAPDFRIYKQKDQEPSTTSKEVDQTQEEEEEEDLI